MGEQYTKSAVNSLKRLPNRGAYDYATVHKIVDTAPILHVSFVDPEHPFPVVLPFLGCVGNFESPDSDHGTAPQDIYLHGYVSGRIFKSGQNAEHEGMPITVAASLLDGLVLSLTPFHNSCNYRSVVAYGYATLVTAPDERLYALKLITDNLLPSRWSNSRVPPTAAELQSTSVLKVRIASASAKIRDGGPSEDRKDEKNAELRERVWTGVVPAWVQWGEPIPADGNVREVEEYVERWRNEENRKGRVGAYEAVEGGK